MFAEKYLNKNQPYVLISEEPDPVLKICVVIPCLREPDIILTLESMINCDLPEAAVEVIIVINHSEIASPEVKNLNQKTKGIIEQWILANRKEGLKFFVVGPVELPKKWAGAGLARKKGMDEAVRRFNILDRKDGLIISLDADTIVEKNYLKVIYTHFQNYPKHVGATIAIKHQAVGLVADHLKGILLYEKYLWYYKEAMRFTGYPYPMFTVGSAFVVTTDAYVKRGGMNRRQAGEDFYFLQNLAQFGKIGEINETTVHPSARLSDRVPFGTGPIMQKWMEGKEDLEKTYSFEAFQNIKQFFDQKEKFFQINKDEYLALVKELPRAVTEFLAEDNFWNELDDLNRNCSSLRTFQNRFFQKFNAFKILKFLNFAHEKYYQKEDLNRQVELLENQL